MLSGQAYAAEAQVEGIGAQPVAAFAETDLQALFEQDAKPMQLAALSEQEMRETDGALIFMPFLIGAGIGLASHYATSWWTNSPMTPLSFGAAAAGGALGGGFTGNILRATGVTSAGAIVKSGV
jgi:hypothetical protein